MPRTKCLENATAPTGASVTTPGRRFFRQFLFTRACQISNVQHIRKSSVDNLDAASCAIPSLPGNCSAVTVKGRILNYLNGLRLGRVPPCEQAVNRLPEPFYKVVNGVTPKLFTLDFNNIECLRRDPVDALPSGEVQMVLPPPGRDRRTETTEQYQTDRFREFSGTIPFER